MPKPIRSRFDFRCSSDGCGRTFSRHFTPAEFIDNDVRCKCGCRAKRVYPSAGVVIPAGTVVPGLRVEYPYYNSQLPVLAGQKPGEQIVMSRQHENEIMRGAWGKSGQRYERNAI